MRQITLQRENIRVEFNEPPSRLEEKLKGINFLPYAWLIGSGVFAYTPFGERSSLEFTCPMKAERRFDGFKSILGISPDMFGEITIDYPCDAEVLEAKERLTRLLTEYYHANLMKIEMTHSYPKKVSKHR